MWTMFLTMALASALAFQPGRWWGEATIPVPVSSGPQARVVVMSVDLSQAQLRILSVPLEAKRKLGAAELSLRSFAEALQGSRTTSEWILVNGGFSSYSVDVPVGLLISNGRVYSTVSRERSKDGGQFRWSGILCRPANGGWQIIPTGAYASGQCDEALQAGPILVERGKNGIQSKELQQRVYLRTAVCVTAGPHMYVVATETPMHLYDLAEWLARPVPQGLGCAQALNLSGETSTGIAISEQRGKTPMKLRFHGPGEFPIPTALMFTAGSVKRRISSPF